MDTAPLIFPIFKIFLYLAPFVALAALAKSARFKGWVGEFLVNRAARRGLNKADYQLFHNVTLPVEGGTTQIDHVAVSRFGIFVIETKNYQGWIFGGEKQPTWTQKIYRHTSKFQNPLRQNYKHTKALEACLGLPSEAFHSVVVFVGGSEFKTPMPPNVCKGTRFLDYIRSFHTSVLNATEVKRAAQQIEAGRLTPSVRTRREHVAHVRELVTGKQAQPACPKCGGAMVQRTTKRGDNAGKVFWGCARYPQCRGVRSMAQAVAGDGEPS